MIQTLESLLFSGKRFYLFEVLTTAKMWKIFKGYEDVFLPTVSQPRITTSIFIYFYYLQMPFEVLSAHISPTVTLIVSSFLTNILLKIHSK